MELSNIYIGKLINNDIIYYDKKNNKIKLENENVTTTLIYKKNGNYYDLKTKEIYYEEKSDGLFISIRKIKV